MRGIVCNVRKMKIGVMMGNGHYFWAKTVMVYLLVGFMCFEGVQSSNLTCYQCTRNTNTECSSSELLPCPEVSDRCVTHISTNGETGFSIKRECGLGPCAFDDVMANKGLGLDTNCDRSRDEYFCIFCCRESGCNKSLATTFTNLPSQPLIWFVLVIERLFKIIHSLCNAP